MATKIAKVGKAGGKAKVGKAGGKAKVGKSASRAASKAVGRVAKGYTVLRVAERVLKPSEKKKRTNKPALIVVAVVTGAGVYFFDPAQGARRRGVARDRAMALLRRGKRQAAQKGDYAAGEMKGAVQEARGKATPDAPKPGLTDQDLAHKVESIIFRDADVPKGKIDVDATGRTVWLRGEVPSEEMKATLVAATQAIAEVEQVENLLHLPGMPAPTRADAPAGVRRDTSFSDPPQQPAPSGGVTGEQKTHSQPEATPAETAASGSGRRAAPLGSEDDEGSEK